MRNFIPAACEPTSCHLFFLMDLWANLKIIHSSHSITLP
jgi:hypothetical protein